MIFEQIERLSCGCNEISGAAPSLSHADVDVMLWVRKARVQNVKDTIQKNSNFPTGSRRFLRRSSLSSACLLLTFLCILLDRTVHHGVSYSK